MGTLALQLPAYGKPEATGTAIYLVLLCLSLLLLFRGFVFVLGLLLDFGGGELGKRILTTQ